MPMAAASNVARTKPVRRENNVPTAMTPLADSTLRPVASDAGSEAGSGAGGGDVTVRHPHGE